MTNLFAENLNPLCTDLGDGVLSVSCRTSRQQAGESLVGTRLEGHKEEQCKVVREKCCENKG